MKTGTPLAYWYTSGTPFIYEGVPRKPLCLLGLLVLGQMVQMIFNLNV